MEPTLWQKVRYLGGKKAPAGPHRDWIAGVLAEPPQRRGLLLAIPNALALSIVGVVSLVMLRALVYGLVTLAGSAAVLGVGAWSTAISRKRAERVMARNGLTPQ